MCRKIIYSIVGSEVVLLGQIHVLKMLFHQKERVIGNINIEI